MDLTGSLIDTNLRIYPTKTLLDFLSAIPSKYDPPSNLLKLVNGTISDKKQIEKEETTTIHIQLSNEDVKNLKNIRKIVHIDTDDKAEETEKVETEVNDTQTEDKNENKELSDEVSKGKKDETTEKTDNNENKELSNELSKEKKDDTTENTEDPSNKENGDCKTLLEQKCQEKEKKAEHFLTTSDIDWLYKYIHERRGKGDKNIPYLHVLLKGAHVEVPDNKVLKRNPVLEARCVKLRAQQEAREYRKMTKSVDNVRMRFPEDNINYQLKQVNRQLIAIGQFIISIFAGFLFGFRGVEWMVGNLDFGFRLLLGVMCALVIALAEIYFLAKKLNEELNVPETLQLGGPPKFADDSYQSYTSPSKAIDKEHQD